MSPSWSSTDDPIADSAPLSIKLLKHGTPTVDPGLPYGMSNGDHRRVSRDTGCQRDTSP